MREPEIFYYDFPEDSEAKAYFMSPKGERGILLLNDRTPLPRDEIARIVEWAKSRPESYFGTYPPPAWQLEYDREHGIVFPQETQKAEPRLNALENALVS